MSVRIFGGGFAPSPPPMKIVTVVERARMNTYTHRNDLHREVHFSDGRFIRVPCITDEGEVSMLEHGLFSLFKTGESMRSLKVDEIERKALTRAKYYFHRRLPDDLLKEIARPARPASGSQPLKWMNHYATQTGSQADLNHPPTAVCPDSDCVQCSARDCPLNDVLHYGTSDGCPSCSVGEVKQN
jgi:hypothetical protein